MKKFISGLIIGILITSSVAANSDMIGKVIDATYPLVIDGNVLDKNAIVVEGTSYIPVRSASDKFGYDVKFIETSKIITMDKIESPVVEEESGDVMEEVIQEQEISVIEKAWHERKRLPYIMDGVNTKKAIEIFTVDGNHYVSINNLFDTAEQNWNGTTFTLEYNGKTFQATEDTTYKEGIDFFYYGRFYIKLSAVGLNAKIQNDTIVIG
ncbi:hypothetical protein [Anaerosolibacter sp.]|uniref:hypothetical protein n=1 Tax=Anaerosolibacter sp. TaxID=1872527 RepID=UPI0039F00920